MKVSIILGIYNAERTLEECLNSIIVQDYPKRNYEIIIVDGGSTDRTLEIINKFIRSFKNIRLFHNPNKLSEGKGMSKDIGVKKSKGEFVVFLDHDNILVEKKWLNNIIEPFKDKKVMASQSLLEYMEDDSLFVKYVNALGVEDPFATPCSLVSQVALYPKRFRIIDGKYYFYTLDRKNVLFGGANGCAFRKKVFSIIDGYTRDVDVFASMAEKGMSVAIPLNGRVHHKTSNDMLGFLKKKGIYFYRFINNEYKLKKFRWVPSDFRGQLRFAISVCSNLSFIVPLLLAIRQVARTRRLFWFLHPFYLFFITLEYGLITLTKMRNFMNYVG